MKKLIILKTKFECYMANVAAIIPMNEIDNFCHRWKIVELALFGSALRDDFGPDSDLDILVTFDADAEWGLFDHAKMQQELQALLKRRIDLVSKRALERSENWIRRHEILKTARVLFPEPYEISPACSRNGFGVA